MLPRTRSLARSHSVRPLPFSRRVGSGPDERGGGVDEALLRLRERAKVHAQVGLGVVRRRARHAEATPEEVRLRLRVELVVKYVSKEGAGAIRCADQND